MDRVTYYLVEEELEAYQALVRALPQSMFLLNKDKKIIGVFNAAPETLANVHVEQIVGHNIQEFADDPDSPFYQACSMLNSSFDSVFRTGTPMKFEFVILDSYFEGTITKLPGERILNQVRDISDIVLKQRDITQKNNNELSVVLMAGGLISWYYDVERQIISSNQDNNVVGKDMPVADLLESIEPEYRQMTVDMFDDIALRGCMHGHIVVPVRTLIGGKQWSDVHAVPHEYDSEGRVTIIVGSQKNVTQEHEDSEKLRRLVLQNELILNNTNSGIVYLTPDMAVEWENVSKLFSDPDIMATGDNGKLSSESGACEVVRRAIDAKMRTTGKYCTRGGMTVECFAQPVLTNGDELEGIVLCIDDVTRKERAVSELAEAKERAEQSDKLKSSFLANMSHEIRTPLNSIVGFAQLIPDAESKEEQQGYIDVVNSNSEMLLNLINDILDLSKIEAGYINRNDAIFNLSDLFTELEMIFSRRVRGGIELICEVPRKEYFVKLDRVRVSQLISNFLTNAVKFTKEGYIKMGFSIVPQQGVRLFVTDTGCGMNADQVRRVFDRFEKFNIFEQGTGLGTSIAKAIADAYDGKIGVESQEGKGSTFWAELPVNSELNVEVETAGAPQCDDAKKQSLAESKIAPPRILIAEDNDSNYMLIKVLLKGFDLKRAVNGLEAVTAMQHEKFDIILMDIRMPVMDGLEATEKIRSFDKQIPIVAVTANAFDEEKRRAFEAGVDDFMTKPVNKVNLLDLIERFVHK